MKKTFLKSVAAVTVLAATVALSSVAAFADTVTDSWTCKIGNTNATETPTWLTLTAVNRNGDEFDISFDDDTTFKNTSAKEITANSIKNSDSDVFKIKAPANNTTVNIYAVTRKSDTGTITATGSELSENNTFDIPGNASKNFAVGSVVLPIKDETYTFKPNTNALLLKVVISYSDGIEVPTSNTYTWKIDPGTTGYSANDFEFAHKTTTTISNTLTYKGKSKITTDSFPSSVSDADSFVSVSKEGTALEGSTEYKNYVVTVTLQSNWLEDKPEATKITGVTPVIDFTNESTATLADGDIIKDYFKVVNDNVKFNSSRLQIAASSKNSYVQFEIDESAAPLTMIINACSTGGTNDSDLRLRKDDTVVSSVIVCGANSGKTGIAYYNLGAGVYKIDGGTGGSKSRDVGITSIQFIKGNNTAETASKIVDEYYAVSENNTYLIHAFKGDTEACSSITLNGSDGTKVEDYDTVYKAVKFADGSTLNASDIGADYILAVKINDTKGKAPDQKIASEKIALADFSFVENNI